MMTIFDKVYEIYQEFLGSVDQSMLKTDKCTRMGNGKSKAILEFLNGFSVELLNDTNLEEGASMRCWWGNNKENAVFITSLEQLTHEFCS